MDAKGDGRTLISGLGASVSQRWQTTPSRVKKEARFVVVLITSTVKDKAHIYRANLQILQLAYISVRNEGSTKNDD